MFDNPTTCSFSSFYILFGEEFTVKPLKYLQKKKIYKHFYLTKIFMFNVQCIYDIIECISQGCLTASVLQVLAVQGKGCVLFCSQEKLRIMMNIDRSKLILGKYHIIFFHLLKDTQNLKNIFQNVYKLAYKDNILSEILIV